jgi:hypothetical protein
MQKIAESSVKAPENKNNLKLFANNPEKIYERTCSLVNLVDRAGVNLAPMIERR